MQGIQKLSNVLIILAQKILQKNETNLLNIIKLLLLDLDKIPFKSMFDRWGCKDFISLKQNLQNYYLTSFQENIKWNNEPISMYRDQFVQLFVFIFDLSFKLDKNNYISEILNMDQNYQSTLEPFVKAVTQRQNYIEKAQRVQRDQNLFDLLQQNQKLKRICDQWIQKYQELKIEYDDLKVLFQKSSQQLNLLKQDHLLLNQMGGSGTVEQALQKVRKDFIDYDHTIDKLKKQLEQKKHILSQKQQQNRNLVITFKNQRAQQKNDELQYANNQIKILQQSLSQLRIQEQDQRLALQQSKNHLKQKESQIEELKSKIRTLQFQALKFQNVKKLHNHYRDKILKDFRELRQ